MEDKRSGIYRLKELKPVGTHYIRSKIREKSVFRSKITNVKWRLIYSEEVSHKTKRVFQEGQFDDFGVQDDDIDFH